MVDLIVPQKEFRFDYRAEPTIAQFHKSNAFFRGIKGPYGSGKSVGCVAEIAMRAVQQAPNSNGVRMTRWGGIRNTYGELISTTIKTFNSWFDGVVSILWDAPIVATVKLGLADGTTMHLEVLFISCDRPSSIGKLKSLDLTGLWLNEASELDKAVLDDGSARVGRFPHKKDGAPLTWCGVIADTNSMDDDHWWHDLDVGPDDPDEAAEIEETKKNLAKVLLELGMNRPIFEFFDQPAALVKINGSYFPNPKAENVRNQQLGIAYWLQLVIGKGDDWIRVKILNEYGRVVDGKPIYQDCWKKDFHVSKKRIEPINGLPVICGLDFGLSPAMVFCQITQKGRILVLGEICAKARSMGLRRFLTEAVPPYIAERFRGYDVTFRIKCDPAGSQRAQSDEKTCYQVMDDLKWKWEPAKTNLFMARKEAVEYCLTTTADAGEPKMLVDPSCKTLIRGFESGYHYRRIQVSGEARYSDEPYDNRFTHPHDALQTVCLDIAVVHVAAQQMNLTPAWMRKLNRHTGGGRRPWRYRGGRA